MEIGVVQAVVMLGILACAVLFFVARPNRDRVRTRLHRKSTRRSHRPPTHRHP
ncbi:hypothetical protein [Burkholderia sp. F1]|uniref:hypothetical protein n=1 Tax=Burkholderia sp. F1 TaxID=3366817 RepID=UPI003D73ED64